VPRNRAVKYTSRHYDAIKQELLDYAQRYYPDTYRDFNEASFGSFMTDAVALIGDMLSLYIDYQFNESMLHTSVEYNNILKQARPLGFQFTGVESSWGDSSFYATIPADSSGSGPDRSYLPILRTGTQVKSTAGTMFVLNQDVDFSNSLNEVRVASVDNATGLPTSFAVKAKGQVVSGRLVQETKIVGSFQSFRRVKLDSLNVSEIVSIVDSEGYEYFGVDFMSQNVLYRALANRDENDVSLAVSLLRPFVVPRRFVVEREKDYTYIQFGAASEPELGDDDMIADPASVVLQQFGKNYIQDASFDPSRFVTSDKFGVAPSNTTLTITSRVNNTRNVNAPAGTITSVSSPKVDFSDLLSLDSSKVSSVRTSLEVYNDESIVGNVSKPNTEELKRRIYNVFPTQNRAVTGLDYEALAYRIPSQFGVPKRVKVIQDNVSTKRNLTMYVVSEDLNGYLTPSNDSLKENLRMWMIKNKMVNDSLDITDAKIVNFGIRFVAIGAAENKTKTEILNSALVTLRQKLAQKSGIGEPYFLTKISDILNHDVDGVVDTVKVEIFTKSGGNYSDIRFDIKSSLSADGRYVDVPKNVILELKYPDVDIEGVVK